MTIKRASIALIALMLLPGLAIAQPAIPPITPATGTANIAVLVGFDDGNFEDSVTVNITCSSGTISPSFATLSDGEGQVFVIDDLPSGVDHTCTVTEVVSENYFGTYLCAPGFAGANDACANPFGPPNLLRCQFDDVNPYVGDGPVNDSVGYCFIENFPEPVDVDITKTWDLTAAGRNDVDTDVRITLFCDAPIVGGARIERDLWRARRNLSDGDYLDEDDEYTGEGVADFSVIPDWYPTAVDPENQRYTECYATEDASDDSAVLVDNGCDESSPMELSIGMGADCTIANTVFYEGIPTLNQYGMAIMALLMLGMGFVGFRRFV